MKIQLTILLLFTYISIVFAQFEPASYMINGNTLPYQVMFPENYNSAQQYPLIIFLHGAGERGNDNTKQLTHGKDFLIDNFRAKYPAIVIAPQCPSESYWSNVEKHSVSGNTKFEFGASETATQPMQTLISLIDNWRKSGHVDTTQVYVGGLSMGGMGTYELLWRMPNTFAAAFPICGGANPEKIAHNTQKTPLWIFHGEIDSVVPASFSRNIYSALMSAGSEVKYTEYPGVNHNSWDNVFQEKHLASWLFNHKK